MRIAISLALALFLLPSAACGGDDDDDDPGDGQADIDASGGTDIDAGDDGEDDGGEIDAGADVDSGPVRLCGGIAGLECNEDEYCDYEADDCGGNDTTGICQARPTECEPEEDTVCGCDGEPYDSKCLAAQAGTDVAEIGLCR